MPSVLEGELRWMGQLTGLAVALFSYARAMQLSFFWSVNHVTAAHGDKRDAQDGW